MKRDKGKTKKKDPTKFCMYCGNKVKMIYEGLETDIYQCLECKKKHGITDLRRLAGFSKQEVKEMNKREKERKR